MAMWATNGKRGLIPGTVGISITVIEYNAGTNSYKTVSSAAYRLDGVPQLAVPDRHARLAAMAVVRAPIHRELADLAVPGQHGGVSAASERCIALVDRHWQRVATPSPFHQP